MSSTKQNLTVRFFFIFHKLGATSLATLYLDKILNKQLSLSQLKLASSKAKKSGELELVLKFARRAIDLYPKNSFGYIEEAKIAFDSGDRVSALRILKNAPTSSATDKAKLLIGNIATPRIDTTSDILERELAGAGSDCDLLYAIETKARAEINAGRGSAAPYNVLLKIQRKQSRYPEIIELLGIMPKRLSQTLSNQLLLAEGLRKTGDQLAAFDVLLRAQIVYPSDRRLLMALSDLLRNDAKREAAYTYMRAAQVCYPEYGAVRQLSFEIDHQLYPQALANLSGILTLPTITLLKFLPMINRATPFFPELTSRIKQVRINAKLILDADKGRKGINPDEQLRVAVKCRWLEEAKRVSIRASRGTQPISIGRQHWLNAVLTNIGDNRILFDIASFNEESDEFLCLYADSSLLISELPKSTKLIELFIPTVFFADPDEEKPSYLTVRTFLSSLYSALRKNSEYAIVPRHQWNWRNCDPKVPNATVFSYHTSSSQCNPKHLHVQESPLSGRCSIDNKGFAGYSSLAEEPSQILDATSKVSLADLRHNLEYLQSTYVNNNVSKYAQTGNRVTFEGKYVFIALQIPTDIVADLAYVTGISLVETVAAKYAGSGTKVIVKRHPYCNSMSVQKCLKDLSDNGTIIVSDASVHDLIAGALIVFTVNSGVGLEALIQMKPVVTTGACDYSFATMANARTPVDLEAVISSPIAVDELRILRFLYFYVHLYTSASTDEGNIRSMIASRLSSITTTEHDA
jgi:tetratricopeptide (TPR) repeat protein